MPGAGTHASVQPHVDDSMHWWIHPGCQMRRDSGVLARLLCVECGQEAVGWWAAAPSSDQLQVLASVSAMQRLLLGSDRFVSNAFAAR
jgi:hypothetical protein